ncbi:hypothetical protein NKR19_g2150 [Coniochaeta hoffmannii]|uniref:Uncharacterized protein n=1 Tax=Coniochaeta hoffmannii TaxID=91930 RepID=A0AA38SB34_9PEZI|nr:hypothetical protein NKR19_g2150 [Coniochaeta hoffmannii]
MALFLFYNVADGVALALTLETSLEAVSRIKTLEETLLPEDMEGEALPSAEWPESGAIEFRDVVASYNPNPIAMKVVSLKILPGQRQRPPRLDEATSSVDASTDALVQRVVRERVRAATRSLSSRTGWTRYAMPTPSSSWTGAGVRGGGGAGGAVGQEEGGEEGEQEGGG